MIKSKPLFCVERLTPNRAPEEIVRSWHLESPQDGAQIEEDSAAFKIEGWALGADDLHDDLHVVLRTSAGTWSYPLSVERLDVIEQFKGGIPAESKQRVCGFSHHLPKELLLEGVTLGFETDGYIHPVFRIRMASKPVPGVTSSRSRSSMSGKNEALDPADLQT